MKANNQTIPGLDSLKPICSTIDDILVNLEQAKSIPIPQALRHLIIIPKEPIVDHFNSNCIKCSEVELCPTLKKIKGFHNDPDWKGFKII